MHQGNGGDPPHGLLEPLLGLVADHPPGLHPQEGRDGLQVVLHPVMDLADGGVLGDQLHLPAAQLRNVAAQDQRAEPLLLVSQRDCPERKAHAP
jgi:hypothetical protein